jgi:hypothetical protein
MFTSLMDVSLLNQNTDHVPVGLIEHSNDIGDRQFVIREEIADRHLAFGGLIKRR